MEVHESAENYLETILMLRERNGMVRSVDVANELGFSKPSVSVAMKKLRNSELVRVDEDGFLFLTKEGQEIAERVYEKHKLLSNWLISLGVEKKIATEDACRIEHVISQESFEKVKEFLHSQGL
ncbi:MAG: metal-dependent transcriptional regulator [Lachnospiraceae bacterium]